MRPNGVVLFRGPSLLNGRPVACVAVGLARASGNAKTGAFVQTYILADGGESPVEALRSGGDEAVCGECPHRPQNGRAGSCYVNAGQAPLAVYRALQRGAYPAFDLAAHLALFAGRLVRLGSYGDPAAVPLDVWEEVCGAAAGWAGYSHNWRTCAPGYARYCMASCETAGDRELALALGYRTFRVRLPEEPLEVGEFACPASEEAGRRLSCAECRACSGALAGGRNASPAVVVHGLPWKVARYREALAALPAGRNARVTLPLV